MLDKKNIVIKVKYPTNKSPGQTAATVTTWHMPRILAAVAVLLMLVSGLFYFLVGGQTPENGQIAAEPAIIIGNPGTQAPSASEPSPLPPPANIEIPTASPATLDQPKDNTKLAVRPAVAQKQTAANKPAIKNKVPIKKPPITDSKAKTVPLHPDKNISRTVLSQTLNGKEPGHELAGSVAASATNPATLFYFTELRNMDGQTVYHEWLHNGKLVARYELLVAADRWRTSSRRSFSDKAKGEWSVKLTDTNHRLLNQKTFHVKTVD